MLLSLLLPHMIPVQPPLSTGKDKTNGIKAHNELSCLLSIFMNEISQITLVFYMQEGMLPIIAPFEKWLSPDQKQFLSVDT